MTNTDAKPAIAIILFIVKVRADTGVPFRLRTSFKFKKF